MSIIKIGYIDEPEEIMNLGDCNKFDVSNVSKDNQLYIYILKNYTDYFKEGNFQFFSDKNIETDIGGVDVIFKDNNGENFNDYIDVKTQYDFVSTGKLILHARDFLPNKPKNREFVFLNSYTTEDNYGNIKKYVQGPILLLSYIFTEILENHKIMKEFRKGLSQLLAITNNKKVQKSRLIWQNKIETLDIYQDFKKYFNGRILNVDGYKVKIKFMESDKYYNGGNSEFYRNILILIDLNGFE